jgi:hypothetical protein
MNQVKRLNEVEFELSNSENSEIAIGKLWSEVKNGEKKWHIKFDKNNFSGREFISLKVFEEKNINGIYSFESKSEEKRELRSWRNLLNEAEKNRLEKLESEIEELKKIGLSRKVEKVDLNDIESLKKRLEYLESLRK